MIGKSYASIASIARFVWCDAAQAKEIMYHKANLNRIMADYTVSTGQGGMWHAVLFCDASELLEACYQATHGKQLFLLLT